MIVEEYETAVIRLGDYVSGSLVDYRLDIQYINDMESESEVQEIKDLAQQVIKVKKGSGHLQHSYLPNAELAEVIEPFPRSTVMMNNNFGQMTMYYLDRNF